MCTTVSCDLVGRQGLAPALNVTGVMVQLDWVTLLVSKVGVLGPVATWALKLRLGDRFRQVRAGWVK